MDIIFIDITKVLGAATDEIYKALNELEKMKAKAVHIDFNDELIEKMAAHVLFPTIIKKDVRVMCDTIDEFLNRAEDIDVRIVKISAPNIPQLIIETAYLIIFEAVMQKLEKYPCGKKITVRYVESCESPT